MSSDTNTLPVKLTQGALDEIARLRQVENLPKEKPLRIGVKGGGCAGFTYILEFDEAQNDDLRFEIDNMPFVMDLTHELYLSNVEIDYQQGLGNRGFTFNNPNAETTCGCGISFG